MEKNGIEYLDAVEIVIFLPIAFVRKWLTDIDWPSTYIEQDAHNNRTQKEFNENPYYLIIEDAVESYWNHRPVNEIIVNIAGRSSEFHAINQLLHDGGKLSDVKLTETVIIK